FCRARRPAWRQSRRLRAFASPEPARSRVPLRPELQPASRASPPSAGSELPPAGPASGAGDARAGGRGAGTEHAGDRLAADRGSADGQRVAPAMAARKVYFNSTCPVCNAGVLSQRKRMGTDAGCRDIEWLDINDDPDALASRGVNIDNVRRKLYVED